MFLSAANDGMFSRIKLSFSFKITNNKWYSKELRAKEIKVERVCMCV